MPYKCYWIKWKPKTKLHVLLYHCFNCLIYIFWFQKINSYFLFTTYTMWIFYTISSIQLVVIRIKYHNLKNNFKSIICPIVVALTGSFLLICSLFNKDYKIVIMLLCSLVYIFFLGLFYFIKIVKNLKIYHQNEQNIEPSILKVLKN